MPQIYPLKLIINSREWYYMLWAACEDGTNRLITARGKVVLFRSHQGLQTYIAAHPEEFAARRPAIYHVRNCRRQILAQRQHLGNVIDLLNLFRDLFNTLKVDDWPVLERKIFCELADHATFHHDLSVFFAACPDVTPEQVVAFADESIRLLLNNAVIWE